MSMRDTHIHTTDQHQFAAFDNYKNKHINSTLLEYHKVHNYSKLKHSSPQKSMHGMKYFV